MALNIYKIASVNLSTSSSTGITFTSIPQGYTDLMIELSYRTDRSSADGDHVRFIFNASTSAIYGWMRLIRYDGSGIFADGTKESGTTPYFGSGAANNSTTSAFSTTIFYIPNYSSSYPKIMNGDGAAENRLTNHHLTLGSGSWSSSAAITSMEFKPYAGTNFVQYCTADLYGVL